MRAVCRFSGLFVCLIALGASLADSDGGPPGDRSDVKQSLRWFETIPAEGTVRVRNPFGDVHARFGGYENQTEILATIQKLEPALPDLEVTRATVDGGLVVTVRYRPDADGASRPRSDGSMDRVDLVLFVPRGFDLDVETLDGKVQVKGVRSNVSISSIQGDIGIAKVEGRVWAKSIHGAIAATLQTGVTPDAQEFTTETGEIEIYLWEDAALDARLATSGRITTDFSIDIEHRRFEEPGKYATASVGPGGPGLSLRSKRGDLLLLRLPKHFKREE